VPPPFFSFVPLGKTFLVFLIEHVIISCVSIGSDLKAKQQKSTSFKVEYDLSSQRNFFSRYLFINHSVLNVQFVCLQPRTTKDHVALNRDSGL
jgi:hypothetical protein